MNCACRAGFCALAAADALFIVHMRGVVFHLNRTVFAYLLALHTADTADLAFLAGKRTLVVIFAKHRRFRFMQRYKLNQMLRAGGNTLFARLAL